jgi:AcrR family transcriptional regulator
VAAVEERVEPTQAADLPSSGFRRSAWSGRSPVSGGAPVRDKIIDATVACIRSRGLAGTSISAVATAAGVSRPTVYAYFDNREEVVSAGLERAAVTVCERVVAAARRRAKTAGDFAVEALVVARREFRAEPALHPLSQLNQAEPLSADRVLSADSLALARLFIEPITSYDPSLAPDMDEITEMLVRWLLSLLMFDSASTSTEARLRAFLRRRVVPAIGLPVSAE